MAKSVLGASVLVDSLVRKESFDPKLEGANPSAIKPIAPSCPLWVSWSVPRVRGFAVRATELESLERQEPFGGGRKPGGEGAIRRGFLVDCDESFSVVTLHIRVSKASCGKEWGSSLGVEQSDSVSTNSTVTRAVGTT